MTEQRERLKQIRRCVVKLGSALLTADGTGLDVGVIQAWAAQMATLRENNIEVVLVTSGSVAVGMQRMARASRPHALHDLQALAAVGQMGLVQTYESAFQAHKLHTAQVLLTHDDLANRKRYLNARVTLNTLLGMGVIPIVNENDTVATDEIRLGDNDTLAALVANLVEAELLIILTDQDGFFDKDPAQYRDARLITEARSGDPALMPMAGGSGPFGRGGMVTKLNAAERASRSGTATVIANGAARDVILRIIQGESVGTHFQAAQGRIAARKQWLAGHIQVAGRLVLDAGAVKVLCESGRSLLPVGVSEVQGDFSRGELVACVDTKGKEVARGLVNYNAKEASLIKGHSSERIEGILGYIDESELIHRDNMIVL